MVTRALLVFALAACTPDFSDATAIVGSPRILAVQAVPAEGAPGTTFALRALDVGASGSADASATTWATCLLQKPLGDPGSVDPACLAEAGPGLDRLGSGGSVHASVPTNACELFGPESPPSVDGQPSPRPADPDSTGGYYLPIRVTAPGTDDSVAFERIACQPSGVVESVFSAFTMGYVLNENPVVASLSRIDEAGGATTIAADAPGQASALTVTPGAAVSFEVAWPSCPAKPAACGGAETYLLIDPVTATLATSRESMVASWYASAGGFVLDRVGREANDDTTHVTNTWTAPASAGTVHLWVVLRDARGGVGWQSYTLRVGS